MDIGKVRVYGTFGPACKDFNTLKEMFLEGMDGIRLNLSHTALEDASDLIEACYRAAGECGIIPELLIDMQGPELRIGMLEFPIQLVNGALIDIDTVPFPQEVKKILAYTPPGQEILLDDGKLLLRTEKPQSISGIQLRVLRGGKLESRKSVALPGCQICMPAMTEFDREQIRKAGHYKVTAIMQPFVRSKEDLLEVRRALDESGWKEIKLYAKIENLKGIDMLAELIPFCDEIVIARGDLGNSMELWKLPAAQKYISAVCRKAGRNFMVVTQMLDSMTHRQVPTRAEVSDIFNAVLDGASSVMVTGETAVGDYPVLTIRYLSRTVREAEAFHGLIIEKDTFRYRNEDETEK